MCLTAPRSLKTSSRLKTTASLRGTQTDCIFVIKSGRSSVTLKRKFSPVMVALSVMGELPASAICNWKRRRSCALAASGDFLVKAASL
jgi:hypothetical protein